MSARRRSTRHLAALSAGLCAVLALSGASGGCQPEEGSQHPSAPRAPDVRPVPMPTPGQPQPAPGDPRPSGKKIITIRTGVPKAEHRPYTVQIHAIGATPHTIDEPVIIAEWSTVLYYDEGTGVSISVLVKPSRPGSTGGYCAIEAGNLHDGPRFIGNNPLQQVTCYLLIRAKK